ncbi:hypothetical protein PGT21_019925 [Puccinia graminis f. sp. tritici]|uniref:Uncharacterized protein n=1 Tax=Puccinia graminis f. sp. tritici TaxID=56615 RepID=A0A5B0QUL1_PUCGR|nr:hypothetical protein PGT21_019925 [Puccinia graminis f. sp. tritici]
MTSIASSLIRSYRIIQQGLLSAVTRNRSFNPQQVSRGLVAKHHPVVLQTPPSTILSGFFRPLGSLPIAASGTTALPFSSNPHYSGFQSFAHQRTFQSSPFRTFTPEPRMSLQRELDGGKSTRMAHDHAPQPVTVPLVDEIVHDHVAARFAFPAPSAEY